MPLGSRVSLAISRGELRWVHVTHSHKIYMNNVLLRINLGLKFFKKYFKRKKKKIHKIKDYFIVKLLECK